MAESTGIAEVIKVTKHPVVEIAEGVEVGGLTVRARMYAPADEFSNDVYLVKISNPYLKHEQASQMEHGEFSFEAGAELKIGDKLEILISPAVPPNRP